MSQGNEEKKARERTEVRGEAVKKKEVEEGERAKEKGGKAEEEAQDNEKAAAGKKAAATADEHGTTDGWQARADEPWREEPWFGTQYQVCPGGLKRALTLAHRPDTNENP